MPISKYYGGHGEEVMRNMKKQYGARAEEVFYATANKRKKRPQDSTKNAMKRAWRHERSA
jgi:hypothetical protein